MRIFDLFRRRRDEDLDDELRAHFELEVRQQMERGRSREEAKAEARRLFGNVAMVREVTREMWPAAWLERLWQDARYGVRTLRKSPGFTIAAVSVLALGVGANTATFSVIDATLLKPLPYPDAEQLAWIGEVIKGNTTDEVTLTPDFLDWRNHNHVFTAMAAFNVFERTLTGVGEPVQLRTVKASASMLPLLEIQPLLGRSFLSTEDQKGRDNVAILSYGLWKQRFGGSKDVVGHPIRLDDGVFTIVGVLPPEFYFPMPEQIDLLTPLGKNEAREMKRSDGMTIVSNVIARLKPGITLERARAEMEVLESHIAPPSFMPSARIIVRVISLRERFVGNMRTALLALLCAVGFLLLLACTNVANLLLSRAVTRQRELAIRSALGASRLRLAKQLFIESLILAAIGCTGGVALTFMTRSILLSLLPQSIPGLQTLPLNFHVLAFATMSSCVSVLVFGIGPAQSGRMSLSRSVNSDGRSVTGGTRRQFWLNLLASTQMAIAILLLTGGGLMLKSFWNMRYRDLGFETAHLLTARMHLSDARYPDRTKQIAFLDELLNSIRHLPGVEGAAMGNLPPGDGHATNGFGIEGRPQQPDGQKPVAEGYSVSTEYFRLLGIPLLQGRGFMESDTAVRNPVALISETFARRNFFGENPIGRRIRLERDAPWSTIVGVVGDVKTAGLGAAPEPVIYFACRQTGMGDGAGILLRTALNPASIVPELRRRVGQLDSQQPIADIQTMDHRLNESISRPRLATVLLVCFAALGLVLASVGLYSVMSFLVRWKFREIGIRLALGARPHDVLRMVLTQSLKVILVGIAGGVCCALLLTRLMRSLLYDVSPADPITFSVVIGSLVLVGLTASYLPAHQASQIDPMTTLRHE